MAVHAHLKNAFTEDEKCHNLMRWLIYTCCAEVDLVCLTLLPLTLAAATFGEWGLFSDFGERDFLRAAAFGEFAFFNMFVRGPLRFPWGCGDLVRFLSIGACILVLVFNPAGLTAAV